MAVFLEISRTGLASITLHRLRSGVTVGFLVTVLLPYLVGLGLSQGLMEEANISVQGGADFYVSAQQFGRPVPIPLSTLDDIRRFKEVAEAVPRIVGGIVLGKEQENAVLVGMPRQRFPTWAPWVQGKFSDSGKLNELVVGTGLARRLSLKVGSFIPPFYHNSEGERISQVVGLFSAEAGIWQSHMIFTSFETAAHIFDQKEVATDLLVYSKPGFQNQVEEALLRLKLGAHKGQPLQIQISSRQDTAALLRAGVRHREGIFTLHFLLAFVVGILGIMVTSGVGLSLRRREIGILKATGWQTDEILLRSAVESFVLALTGASLAILLAFVWLKWFNGFWIASIFLTGVTAAPEFPVPFRLAPIPVLVAFLVGLVLVGSGTLFSSWRAATAAPNEAMRK